MNQHASATDPRGLWVYAICRQADETRLRGIAGVGGGEVTVLTGAGLTAVTEDVSLAEFGEQALRASLEDMAWLEATARAHHAVIDVIARSEPVVPMRLATVYSGAGSLQAMLTARSAEILDVLGKVTARSEWGVKAFAVAGSTAGAGAGESQLAGQAAGSAGGGAAYLRRRRDSLAAQQQGRRSAVAAAERIHDSLSRLAVASRLHAPQSPQLTGTPEVMVLNAAYLLDERNGDTLRRAVAGLAEDSPAVRLELTGPWPPYSFAEITERTGDDR